MPIASFISRMSSDNLSAAEMVDRLLATPAEDRAGVLHEMCEGAAALPWEALIDHADGMILADAGRATAVCEVLADLADRCGSDLDRARARWAQARALSYSGRFAEALRACDEGREIAERSGHALEAARLRMVSMHALGELGRLNEAIAAGETARAAFLAAGESALAARADLNIGTAHQRADDPATALQRFDRARPHLFDQPMILGALDNNRGEALVALNDFAGAEGAYAQALAALQSAHADLGAAIAESNLAELAARQGRLQKAMHHFERARRILERGVSPAHLARLIAEQADAMSLLGMPREALAEYRRALTELDQQGLALEAARARSGLGMTLLRLGRLQEAEAALVDAAAAFDELGHATARARVDLLRAELAARNGQTGDAQALVDAALAALEDRPADTAIARLVRARLLMMDGSDLRGAEADANAALELATRLDLVPFRADALALRGALRRRQGRLDQAIDDLHAATALVERLRGALAAERFRAAFHGDRASTYEKLAEALLHRGDKDDIARAFAVIEQAKSRSLLDHMQRDLEDDESRVQANDGPETALLRRLEETRGRLNALYSVVNDDGRQAPADHAAWRERMRQCEREIDDIESRLATTGRMGALFGRTLSADEAQQLLAAEQAIIEYFTIDDEIAAFVVRCDGLTVHRRLSSVGEVGSLLAGLQFQINRALRPGAMNGPRADRLLADARRDLARLGGLLLGPLAPDLGGAEHLIIVPHGVLHATPFHALFVNDAHLLQSHVISYVPSATLLRHLASRRPAGEAQGVMHSPMVVGVADAQAPQIESEARVVQCLLQCESAASFINEHATTERVARAMPQASLIHLACHGRHIGDLPSASGLRLADRWLTVRDMLRLNLRARLVALSGCDTGLSRVNAGDELIGLLRGLFAAGAASIVASLWRVDDAATSRFFETFYDRLRTLDGRVTAANAHAMRDAQLAMMAEQPHPAFWAPFVLTGQP